MCGSIHPNTQDNVQYSGLLLTIFLLFREFTWPSLMETRQQGFLHSQPLREADEDLVSEVNLSNPIMTEEEREEIQHELAKLEEEISTLRQVLWSKEKQHAELKQKLGITPLSELRNNFSRGWHDMQSSTAYKKTSETLSTAGQRTSAAFNTLGTAISRKFGDMSMAGLELLFPRRQGRWYRGRAWQSSPPQQAPALRTHPLTAADTSERPAVLRSSNYEDRT
ncbi:tumor protein D53 isoform X7 [Lates japonicus]|uniref:Tumor protein D53 isoform X7 n=1 Tax=Lates japonicus TaxID=270547 RepID=A0AAD3RG18_LATJO|nr:tumor protein D53 isoform X7 [Lates japonicus]